jgi:hypothetical protein
MAQTVIVILIFLLATAAGAVKLYRFFRKPAPGSGCAPDACASCPYHANSSCDKKNKEK